MQQRCTLVAVAALSVATAIGCDRNLNSGSMPALDAGRPALAMRELATFHKKARHVVVIIQENRSFDDLFQGFPGADTVSSGYISTGKQVPLSPVGLAAPYDISHGHNDVIKAEDGGKMDGFDQEWHSTPPPSSNYTMPPYPQYGYVPPADTGPYFSMGEQYVVADRMFSSVMDGSWQAHQYLVAAWAGSTWGQPSSYRYWGCDAPPGTTIGLLDHNGNPSGSTYPCFGYPTLADELDAKGLSWRHYAAANTDHGYIWSTFDDNTQIRNGPDWAADVINPPSQFLTDVAAGKLAHVTWIAPLFADSDHPNAMTTNGPDWVASLVNAIGTSRFWNDTVIFIVWDDWGGWYDHVLPPTVDFDGLGLRVPFIVLSPYALSGKVTHRQYEFGSIAKFIEADFGLHVLNAADARARLFGNNVFDWDQAPRAFVPFQPIHRGGAAWQRVPAAHAWEPRDFGD